jgi:hypothetical protein
LEFCAQKKNVLEELKGIVRPGPEIGPPQATRRANNDGAKSKFFRGLRRAARKKNNAPIQDVAVTV